MPQRTGTSRSGRVYAYYKCAGRAQKRPEACRGNTIPSARLDSLVLSALEERLSLRALLSTVEVDDTTIRILGNREVLAAAVSRRNTGDVVQFSEPKWRARRDSNS